MKTIIESNCAMNLTLVDASNFVKYADGGDRYLVLFNGHNVFSTNDLEYAKGRYNVAKEMIDKCRAGLVGYFGCELHF